MNFIKRVSASITATLDGALDQLENQEAIIKESVKQTARATAKMQCRLNVLKQQECNLEQQLETTKQHSKIWHERAQTLVHADEKKALQCLSRHNSYCAEAKRIEQSLLKHSQLIEQAEHHLLELKTKLDTIKHRHLSLSNRQTVADTHHLNTVAHRSLEIEDTFERWETNIISKELTQTESSLLDPLEAEFKIQEHNSELLTQLEALKNESAS